MSPSASFFLVLQTWRKICPGPQKRPFRVGRWPTGMVLPAFGEVGVMPFLVAAEAAVGTESSPMRTMRER